MAIPRKYVGQFPRLAGTARVSIHVGCSGHRMPSFDNACSTKVHVIQQRVCTRNFASERSKKPSTKRSRAELINFRAELINRQRALDQHGHYEATLNKQPLIDEVERIGISSKLLAQLTEFIWPRYWFPSMPAVQLVEYLKTWESWNGDMSKMPHHLFNYEMDLRKTATDPLNLKNWLDGGWKGKPISLVAQTVQLVAMQHLMVTGEKQVPGLQFGCYLLDVAMQLGNIDAAAILLKLSIAKTTGDFVRKGELSINEAGAKAVVFPKVEDSPEDCLWKVVEAYMSTEYSDNRLGLRRHSPHQLGWALDVLLHTVEHTAGGHDMSGYDLKHLAFTEDPWTHLKRITVYCYRNKMAVDGYSQSRLWQLYLTTLRHLTDLRDPEAEFEYTIVAGPASPGKENDLEQTLTSAASTGNAEACWLCAIHFWQKDGVLPYISQAASRSPKEINELLESVGFDWARAAVYASCIKTPYGGGPGVFVNRGLTLAAFYKVLDQPQEGEALFEDLIEWTSDNHQFPRNLSSQLTRFLAEYTSRYPEKRRDENIRTGKLTLGSKDECRGIVRGATDFQAILESLRKSFITAPLSAG